jgi:hypothetical protein
MEPHREEATEGGLLAARVEEMARRLAALETTVSDLEREIRELAEKEEVEALE